MLKRTVKSGDIIVLGERRKAKRDEQNGKKKYRKKNPQTARLCADDMLYRTKMISYHDYAEAMKKYGLERGVRGSVARNISTSEYYRNLQRQNEKLQANVQQLEQQEKEAEKQLKHVKGEVNTEKLRKAATDITTNITERIGSAIGTGKVKRLENENEKLKKELSDSNQKLVAQQNIINTRCYEIESLKAEHANDIARYDYILNRICNFFPEVNAMESIIEECETMGLEDNKTRLLIHGSPIRFTGSLYSKEYSRHFETEDSLVRVKQLPEHKDKFHLCIDGISPIEWFREKFQELRQALGFSHEEDSNNRGVRR